MLRYKFDVLASFKVIGYTSYKLRKEKVFGEATIQQLRNGEKVSWANLETLCKYLKCQPGDVIEYVPDELA